MIPRKFDDITAEWLTTALKSSRAADGRVTGIEFGSVGVGLGLVGALSRLTLTYEGGEGPATIVAKLPAAGEASRFVAQVLSMYKREVGFYRDLSSTSALSYPACYYADYDAETDDFVLLLADVGRGRTVDQLAGCSVADAELAVDRLADLHAGFWSHPMLEQSDWLRRLCDSPFPESVVFSYQQSWEPAQQLFGDRMVPEIKDLGDRFDVMFPKLCERLSEPPMTLSHGDYRLDNMFFFDDKPDVVLCDWQLVDRSRGARDLTYFLTQSLTTACRAEHQARLIQRYVDRLAAGGVSGYDFDTVWEDYKVAAVFGWAYGIIAAGGLDHEDPRARELTGEMIQRSADAIVDLECLA
jgi:hypothetical protein